MSIFIIYSISLYIVSISFLFLYTHITDLNFPVLDFILFQLPRISYLFQIPYLPLDIAYLPLDIAYLPLYIVYLPRILYFYPGYLIFTLDILFLPWISYFYPGYRISTLDILFLPRILYFYPGYLISTLDILFLPWISYFYPGYRIPTPDISFLPRISHYYPVSGPGAATALGKLTKTINFSKFDFMQGVVATVTGIHCYNPPFSLLTPLLCCYYPLCYGVSVYCIGINLPAIISQT